MWKNVKKYVESLNKKVFHIDFTHFYSKKLFIVKEKESFPHHCGKLSDLLTNIVENLS